nr:hypothetical protein [Gammaproteobacteria bacterium]NIX56424.1 hypothetical protein [candidate division Zixibacteria bacterium]
VHDQTQGMILIGGPSKHYAWDDQLMLDQINMILRSDRRISWLIADSPRTPISFADKIASLRAENASYKSWKHVGRDWLPSRLREAGYVWVSEDSVSMVYEALTAGAATGILKVNGNRAGKISGNIERLKSKGFISDYETWLVSDDLSPPPEALDEAARSAEWLLQRLESNH